MLRQLFFTVLFFAITTISAQKNIGIGINGGIPIGNLENSHKAAFGFEANYLFNVNSYMDVGASAGYLFFSPEDGSENKSYVPVAAAIKINSSSDKWFVQGDLGYAIPITPEGDEGGIYFRPMLGYNITESFGLNASYIGIKKWENQGPTFAYIALGAMFRI